MSACSAFSKKSSGYAEISDTYSNKTPTFVPTETAPKKTKDDFGVLEITQDGPGYKINLALDTGDENVNFTMDLPEQSSASKQLALQDKLDQTTTTTVTKTDAAPVIEDVPVQQNPEDDFATDDAQSISETVPTPAPVQQKTQTQLSNEQAAQDNMNTTQDSLAQGPSSNDYFVSAQTQFYEDNYMGALTDIENAIKLDDTQALSYAIKGSIMYKLGNTQAAKTAWQKALSLNPKLKSVELSLQYLVGQ